MSQSVAHCHLIACLATPLPHRYRTRPRHALLIEPTPLTVRPLLLPSESRWETRSRSLRATPRKVTQKVPQQQTNIRTGTTTIHSPIDDTPRPWPKLHPRPSPRWCHKARPHPPPPPTNTHTPSLRPAQTTHGIAQHNHNTTTSRHTTIWVRETRVLAPSRAMSIRRRPPRRLSKTQQPLPPPSLSTCSTMRPSTPRRRKWH